MVSVVGESASRLLLRLRLERLGEDLIAVGMGAFEKPTGTRLEKHIFVTDQGDYYEIADGLPQHPGY